jgi:hypothetical protein
LHLPMTKFLFPVNQTDWSNEPQPNTTKNHLFLQPVISTGTRTLTLNKPSLVSNILLLHEHLLLSHTPKSTDNRNVSPTLLQ